LAWKTILNSFRRDKDFESPTHYSYHDKEFYAHASLWIGVQGHDVTPERTRFITVNMETTITHLKY